MTTKIKKQKLYGICVKNKSIGKYYFVFNTQILDNIIQPHEILHNNVIRVFRDYQKVEKIYAKILKFLKKNTNNNYYVFIFKLNSPKNPFDYGSRNSTGLRIRVTVDYSLDEKLKKKHIRKKKISKLKSL